MIADAKHLIFEGVLQAVGEGADASVTGVLVDEQFGSTVPEEARARSLKLAMPAERSGQNMFDFQYGDDFGAHIERFDPDFTKVLVRYNPDGDAEDNREQLGKLKRLSDWLQAHERKFLFELLVPAEPAQLESVDGDTDRYDAELRPELMRRAIAEIQDAGIEVDIWKIEGVDERSDCEMLVAQARTGGRDGVVCVVLGRGADDAKVDHWLAQAAPGRGLRRLRDRTLDLVGSAEGIRRRQDRTRGGSAARSPRTTCASSRSTSAPRARPPSPPSRPAAGVTVMKMRQSLAELERAFVKEISLDRHRRDSLRRTTEQRALKREVRPASQARLGALRPARARADHDRGDRHRDDVPHALSAAGLTVSAEGQARAGPRRGAGSGKREAGSGKLRARSARLAEIAQRIVHVGADVLAKLGALRRPRDGSPGRSPSGTPARPGAPEYRCAPSRP